MNAHLKGRVFQKKGVSYLVLHEDAPSAEYVLVRALTRDRRVERMPCNIVTSCLFGKEPVQAGRAD
jgi:hypothetical protein